MSSYIVSTADGQVVAQGDKADPQDPRYEPEQANRKAIDQAITAALVELQNLIDAPAVADVPAGTMTTAQLSNVARSMRDAVQQNRAGAQKVAQTLKRTIRLVRGDFDGTD